MWKGGLWYILNKEIGTVQIHIAGLPVMERSVFAFIMAQYLSISAKTMIVEKDFEFLTLSYIAKQSKADFLEVLIEDLYKNPQKELAKIAATEKKLIVIGTRERMPRDYSFICSLLYSNLIGQIRYLVRENDFCELSDSAKFMAVLPNNTIDLLKTLTHIPYGLEENARFAGVDISRLEELAIKNSKQMEMIVKDVLQIKGELKIPVYKVSSLELGGDIHDLRMLIEE